MEDSKDLENRIAPSPMQSLQSIQGAADPTITVIGPRVAWKDRKALELERQMRNSSGFEEKAEERDEFQSRTANFRVLNPQSPTTVSITERQDSPAFIQELVSKFSSADNAPKSVTELISSMSQRSSPQKEASKGRVLSPSSASKMSSQIRKEEGTEEGHADHVPQVPADNLIASSLKRGETPLGDIHHGSFKLSESISPQKNQFEFMFPSKQSYAPNDINFAFPLSSSKSQGQTANIGAIKQTASEKEPQTPRSIFDSLVFTDQPIWRPPPESALSPSKGEMQFVPHYFTNTEEYRFVEGGAQEARRASFPIQIQPITEESAIHSFIASQPSPHPTQKGAPSPGVLDSLKFPLTEGSSVLGQKFGESPAPALSHGTMSLPSLSSASLQFMEGNMPSQIFELAEQPAEVQRKCYKKENRCLLPNPLQIVLKREYLQASNYILDGVVSVKLVGDDGKDLSSSKQNILQSVDEGLKHSLDLAKGTNFSLKIGDTTEGTNVRLLFTITYRVRGNRLCEERVLSKPFEVCSNSKRKRKLTSQLQQQKAESGGSV